MRIHALKKQKNILEQFSSLLRYHRALGISYYPNAANTERPASGEQPKAALPQAVHSHKNETPPSLHLIEKPQSKQEERREFASSLAELQKNAVDCQKCELAAKRLGTIFGSGGASINLLIVGEWLSCVSAQECSERIFGEEEDMMLSRMLEALHLKKNEVYITNSIKCCLPKSIQVSLPQAECCSRHYLQSQIHLLKPKIILVMGSISMKALLKGNKPLSQQRGKLLEYRDLDKKLIPVVATYHPSFLLKNTDMKPETWSDLQLVGRYLQQTNRN